VTIPGGISCRPGIVSPYEWKLNSQMWFAAPSMPELHPWIFAVVQRLLEGDRRFLRLFARSSADEWDDIIPSDRNP
jgi:hypothetical protein